MSVDNKKGLSPVIATVLLVSLVLILAAIIFLWMKGFVSEQIQKNGAPISDACNNVVFDVEYEVLPEDVSLQLVNKGNVPISAIDVKFFTNGDSSIEQFDLSADVLGSSTLQTIPKGSADRIIVYPMVLGNVVGKKLNKAVTCTDKGKEIIIN
jgi:flagellin-like protein